MRNRNKLVGLLSVALCAVLVLQGAFPMGAFAAESTAKATAEQTTKLAATDKSSSDAAENESSSADKEDKKAAASAAAKGKTTKERKAKAVGGAEKLTLHGARLTFESDDPLGSDVYSYSAKGYFARVGIDSTDEDGANPVWLGYRFTLEVPEGIDKDNCKFQAASSKWLMDLDSGTKPAEATYDPDTRTWTLEGKYLYNNASNPLGSSGAKEYGRSVIVEVVKMAQGQQIQPTIEVWLPEKAGNSSTGVEQGSIATVKTPNAKTALRTQISRTDAAWYSPSTGKTYPTQAEAAADGATDAIHGRISTLLVQADSGTYDSTKDRTGMAEYAANQTITADIPLSVTFNGQTDSTSSLQPIVLSDTAVGWADYYGTKRTEAKASQQGSTLKMEITALEQTALLRGEVNIFTPIPDSDTDKDNRRLVVAEPEVSKALHIGDIESYAIDNTLANQKTIKLAPFYSGDFAGATNTWLRFIDLRTHGSWTHPTSMSLGEDLEVGFRLESTVSEAEYAINSYDLLVKLDTDGYVVDTSKHNRLQDWWLTYNGFGFFNSYKLKFGVLKNGADNWASDAAQMAGTKDDLVFYDDVNSVPAGAKIAAVLIQARNGELSAEVEYPYLRNTVYATEDAKACGKVYQITMTADYWQGDKTPAKGDDPTATIKTDPSYQKSSWDEDNNYYPDVPEHRTGDSMLLQGYKLKNFVQKNMNGINSATDTAKSTYDIATGDRRVDTQCSFEIGLGSDSPADNPDQEFELVLKIPNNGTVDIDPNAFYVDATYVAGASEDSAGTFLGARPTKVEEIDGDYVVTFSVKGTGSHNICYSGNLGDPFDPQNDINIGTHKVQYTIEVSQSSAKALNGSGVQTAEYIVVKSNTAGFKKVANDTVVDSDAEVAYHLNMSATNQSLTGSLLLDIFPFDGDGRGTKMSQGSSYSVDKPVELKVSTVNSTVQTAIDLYYTTDAAIQKNPVNTVADIKGISFTGDTVNALGVTWTKATASKASDDMWEYAIPADAKAIAASGTVGQNEVPDFRIYLQTKDFAQGDKLVNSAGFDANEFSKPMNSTSEPTYSAKRTITGKAWLDANANGIQDASETTGVAGLTVDLYNGSSDTRAVSKIASTTTAADGTYVFESVPSSEEQFYVEFSGAGLSKYAVTKIHAQGDATDTDSDVTGDPSNNDPTKLISDKVYVLTTEQMSLLKKSEVTVKLDAGLLQAYTVDFDTDGGTPAIDSQKVVTGDTAAKPDNPTKENFVFKGWTLDGKDYDFASPVTNNITLKAKWEPATPVSLPIAGVKTLTGDKTNTDIKAGQFAFTVKQTSGDANAVSGVPTKEVTTKAGAAAGAELDFGTWKFSKAGEYVFTVSEKEPAAGYTKAADATVTVKVTFANEKLSAKVTYSTGDKLTFENTYTSPAAAGETLAGKVDLTGDKDLKDGEFKFVIKQTAGDTDSVEGLPTGDITNKADGSFDLGDLKFSQPGTYTFEVSAVDEGKEGYAYDDTVYEVTYKVTLDPATNKYKIDKTITKKGSTEPVNEVAFKNTYTASPVKVENIKGIKTLEGGEKSNTDITAGMFTFTVEQIAGDKAHVEGVPTGDVATTDGTDAGAELDFGTWTFKRPGTYTFKVSENAPAAGYTKADDVELTVQVDLKDGTLAPTVTGDLTFKNVYTYPSATNPSDLTGKVELNGDKTSSDIKNGQFSFNIEADANNNPDGYELPNTSVTNKADGSIDLGGITFKRPGSYKFTISAEDAGEKGYTYDKSVYEVTYTVELDPDTNEFVVSYVITKDGVEADAVVFAHTFTAEPVPNVPADTAGSNDNTDKSSKKKVTQWVPATGDGMGIAVGAVSAAAVCGAIALALSRRREK